jgi:predicted HicB family RNase H-like nuclease
MTKPNRKSTRTYVLKYSKNLNVRVTPEQMIRWKAAAGDKTLTDWIRATLDREAG